MFFAETFIPAIGFVYYVILPKNISPIRLYQSASNEHTGVVWVWQPARDVTVLLKTTMTAPKKVSVAAAVASVVSELESAFHWKKSKERHWRLSLDWKHVFRFFSRLA